MPCSPMLTQESLAAWGDLPLWLGVPVLGTAVGDGPTLRGVPTDHVLLLDA
jgi:hypothetical protein